jgi:diacylglycerol kinase
MDLSKKAICEVKAATATTNKKKPSVNTAAIVPVIITIMMMLNIGMVIINSIEESVVNTNSEEMTSFSASYENQDSMATILTMLLTIMLFSIVIMMARKPIIMWLSHF